MAARRACEQCGFALLAGEAPLDAPRDAVLPRSVVERAELTGIPQSTIPAIERDRVKLGVERARVLARAFRCRPAVLVLSGPSVASGGGGS